MGDWFCSWEGNAMPGVRASAQPHQSKSTIGDTTTASHKTKRTIRISTVFCLTWVGGM